MKEVFLIFVFLIFFICIYMSGWHAKRWLNWKFSYEPLVEQRIEHLEERVSALENNSNVSPGQIPN
jgi:hypothetical protein